MMSNLKFRFITTSKVEEFCERLSELNISELGLGNYQNEYLLKLLTYKKYFVSIYATVLNELFANTNKPPKEIFLIDYGAGNGLLGLFAKFCGVGKVVPVDNSPACVGSRQILSEKLNLPLFENINGDTDVLKKYVDDPPDALLATDVIEHIYDLDKFFSTLQIVNKHLIMIFTTASNDENWWKKKKLMKDQKKDEWKGSGIKNGSSSNDSFRTVRSNIIKNQIPGVSYSELQLLVTHTRGLRKDNIERVCKVYKADGIIPTQIIHPTNTCDPISGSWTERFLSYNEYRALFKRHGFSLTIKYGFYNEFQGGIKGTILKLANYMIKLVGKKGGLFSPFIILIGK